MSCFLFDPCISLSCFKAVHHPDISVATELTRPPAWSKASVLQMEDPKIKRTVRDSRWDWHV